MGKPLTKEQVAEVRRLFPDHTKQEIREMTGFGLSTIDRIQARFHLRKSQEHLHNMGVRAGKASSIARGGDNSACYTPEAIAKRVASYKRTFREEQVRRSWGIRQLTKIKVLRQPKQKVSQRSYLKSLGYILDEQNCIAYYTEETTRAVKMERNWSKRIHQYYKFKPYYEDEHQRERDLLAVAGE